MAGDAVVAAVWRPPRPRRAASAPAPLASVGKTKKKAPAAVMLSVMPLSGGYRLGERHAARDARAVAEVDVAGDDGHPRAGVAVRRAARWVLAFVSALGEKISYHD